MENRKGFSVPWALLILIAGIVLRFGVNGYNTVGDILIILGAALTVIGFLIVVLAFGAVAAYGNSTAGKIDRYSKSLRKRG